jgi:M6 family metalloprotease-like protein
MSAIFGETLTFGQKNGPDVQLVVFGDEYYARHETKDGYTVVYDTDLGLFCYALVINDRFVSSGVPLTKDAPPGVRRHLEEPEPVRQERHQARRRASLPPPASHPLSATLRTLGPNQGLLEGRRLSVGNVRGLTILVQFQDIASTVSQSDVAEMLNGAHYTRNGNFCSAREYFSLVSSGKLDYTNDVVGPFTLSRDRQYYVENLLVNEALDLAVAAGVDLSRYDSRGDHIVDALNVLYAGQTQYLGELWPHNFFLDLRYGSMRTNFYLLTSMGRSPDDLSIGTFCHENGHLLCRFPDMYDYGNRDGDGVESAGIGAYCLMGSGNHLNQGRTPSPVCGYLRYLAGWCDNVVPLSEPGEYEVAHGDYRTVLKVETDAPNEYFILENRAKIGLDQHLPSSGLAAYHCDTRGSNEWQEGSSARHYQCALLQADGHQDLENNANQGDGGDLFGPVAGIALSHATRPSSRRWDGADSGLAVSKITSPGPTIRFTLGGAEVGPMVRGEAIPALAIPDDDPNGISSAIVLPESGLARALRVRVDITHTFIGDLVVDLTSPAGRTVTLHNRAGASQDNLITTFDSALLPALAGLVGTAMGGTWTLRVKDVAGQDVGKLNRWSMEAGLAGGEETIRLESAPALKIPDNDPTGISHAVVVGQAGIVRSIKVSVDITHTYIGDLRLELLAPSGRRALLHGQLGGNTKNLVVTYESAPGSPLTSLVGQSAQGSWILRVTDLGGLDVGTLNRWTLELRAG